MGALVWTCAAAGAEPPREKPIWLAVTRPMFERALAPLAEHRRAEGLEVVISTETVERALAKLPRRPACILLVGDDSDKPTDADQPWRVPARRLDFYRWREVQPPTFASDAAWGDFDGDRLPDVPVGRLPVKSARELERVSAKIVAHETRPARPNDLQLSVWAGSAMYGAVIDRLADTLLLTTLKSKSPAWLEPWVKTTDPPAEPMEQGQPQEGVFLEQVRRGGLMTLLIGHANRTSFIASSREQLTAREDATDLARGGPGSPMIIVACDAGNFIDPNARGRPSVGIAASVVPAGMPSLGEAFLLAPGGPVAVVAATAETHPLPNAYLGRAMLEQLAHPYRRLGSWFLAAQRQAAAMRDPLLETTLADVEGKLDERINIARLQRDQQLVYAILGDPATRLRLPRPLELAVQPQEGGGWRWRVVSPPPGARLLEVGLRPDPPGPDLQGPPLPATRPAPPPGAREVPEVPQRHACLLWSFAPLPPAGQVWQGTVKGRGTLRVIAADKQNLWVGTVRLGEQKSP